MPVKLTEEQRYEIAEAMIRQLRKHNGWKELDDPDVEPQLTGTALASERAGGLATVAKVGFVNRLSPS